MILKTEYNPSNLPFTTLLFSLNSHNRKTCTAISSLHPGRRLCQLSGCDLHVFFFYDKYTLYFTGLQLRNSEQNGFHFFITLSFLNQTLRCAPHWNRLSETIPMSGHTIGFDWEIRQLAFWKLSILDLICCPTSASASFQLTNLIMYRLLYILRTKWN